MECHKGKLKVAQVSTLHPFGRCAVGFLHKSPGNLSAAEICNKNE